MNRNKKGLIILLLLLQSYNFTYAEDFSNEVDKEDEIRIELREEVRQNKKSNNKLLFSQKNQLTNWKKQNKKLLIYKNKLLKKELQKRRKYHKNLLYLYNKNFDNNILKNIINNWLLITSFEKEYNNFKS